MTDSAYVYTSTGHATTGSYIYADFSDPILLTFSKNTVAFKFESGLILPFGLDLPDANNNNLDNATITGNLLNYTNNAEQTGTHGIMAGYSINYNIRHNYLDSCGYGVVIEGLADQEYTSGAIAYNIFRANEYYAITMGGMNGVPIYNNTFYSNKPTSSNEPIISIAENTQVADTQYAHRTKIKNNIFYSVRNQRMIVIEDTASQTLECDYNVYWVAAGDHQPKFYIESTEYTFAQWQALGHDVHSVVVNPGFVDTVNFIPTTKLEYGTDLGDEFDAGLSPISEWVAGSYPDTIVQYGDWQVGAVLLPAVADYYVSPSGNDSDAGTFEEPWLTPQKAFETADAGDTVYFRGGTYSPSVYESGADIYLYDPDGGRGNNGTSSNRIYYMNYPGETPIIDFSDCTPPGNYNTGIYLDEVHYVGFYGLTLQGLATGGVSGPNVNVFEAYACSNIHYERLVVKNNAGAGIRSFSGMGDDVGIYSDTTRIINCDAFNNVDYGHNYADGFKFDQDKDAYLYFEGNRAVFNSDDGFDISGSALRIFINNWSFGNGWYAGGNGNGFKTGALRDTVDYSTLIFVSNLAAFNRDLNEDGGCGFGTPDFVVSDTSYRRSNARYYNNTSYRNDIGFLEFANALYPYRNSVYRNNIAYNSRYEQDGRDINVQILTYPYPESYNTWDRVSGGYSFEETDSVTVTAADFIHTDSTLAVYEMMLARNADGSLPDITFMKLASTSDLIDAGTDYGYDEIASVPGVPALSYFGASPDIGYAEFGEEVTIYNPYDGVDFTDSVRSNLHMHTKESDGDQSVAERLLGGIPGMTDGYTDRSYRILAIADHDSYEASPYLGQFSGPGSTFPWHRYTGLTSYTPTTTYVWATDTSSIYYAGIGSSGTFAIRANELTGCQEENNYYTHINSYFSNIGYSDCPSGGFDRYFQDIADSAGMAVINHPGRHVAGTELYLDYIMDYYGILIGMEIHNAGDYRPTQNPRVLWDSINTALPPDSLFWGFSNTDLHQGAYTDDPWKNYNIHFIDTLTETAFRTNLQNGAFTAHYAGQFDDFGGNDAYPTASLTGVDISNNVITLTAANADSIRWFGNYSDTLTTASSIDVTLYYETSNFVRAELYRGGYITYTQPFGIELLSEDEPQIDSTGTDIIIFTLADQTGTATINTTNHTVAIEVSYTANVASLTPTITLSYGATVIPASGVARDFTSPLPYTVTAGDGLTFQEWTVTVTQEAEPEPDPVASTGQIVKFNGKIVKR
jgi:hypothetical protein